MSVRDTDDPVDDPNVADWRAGAPPVPHLTEADWRRLLDGTSQGAARTAAEDHIAGCPECAEVFKAARTAAKDAVRTAAVETPTAPRRAGFAPPLAALAAMSMAVLALVVWWPVSTSVPVKDVPVPEVAEPAVPASGTPATPSDPFVALRAAPPPVVVAAEQLLVMRGQPGQQAYLEALAAALAPYEQGEYAEAARALAPLVEERPEGFEPRFYLGVSLLLDARPAEAMPVLERARALASAARETEADAWLAHARRLAAPR